LEKGEKERKDVLDGLREDTLEEGNYYERNRPNTDPEHA
jgi:hypothetical protein